MTQALFVGLSVVAMAAAFPLAARAQEDEFDPSAEAQPPVTLDELVDTLSPYGEWIDTPAYGRVWRPFASEVGDDFTPYATNGQWQPTDQGWYFDSHYRWGWAPFHYGRWVYDPGARWLWAPDTVWGPAWVHWRVAPGGVVAWVPIAPHAVVVDPSLYTRLWIAVSLRNMRSPHLTRCLEQPRWGQGVRAGAPPIHGTPVAPAPTWRGYPVARPREPGRVVSVPVMGGVPPTAPARGWATPATAPAGAPARQWAPPAAASMPARPAPTFRGTPPGDRPQPAVPQPRHEPNGFQRVGLPPHR